MKNMPARVKKCVTREQLERVINICNSDNANEELVATLIEQLSENYFPDPTLEVVVHSNHITRFDDGVLRNVIGSNELVWTIAWVYSHLSPNIITESFWEAFKFILNHQKEWEVSVKIMTHYEFYTFIRRGEIKQTNL